MKGSWKTTAGGLLVLLSGALKVLPDNAPGAAYIKPYSDVLLYLGTGFGLLVARDNKVTSEDVGLHENTTALAGVDRPDVSAP